jgi:tetratricopeptide (TPR) repeat protein
VISLALAPDGRTLASGDADGTIQFWRAAADREARARKTDPDPDDPDDPATRNNTADQLWKAGRVAEAEAAYRKARSRLERMAVAAPGAAECRQERARSCFSLGLLLSATGQAQQAAEARGQAQELWQKLPPDRQQVLVRAVVDLGNRLRLTRRFREAEEAFDLAIELSPQDPEAWFCRGQVYLQKGQPEKVIEDSSKAIEFDAKAGGQPEGRGRRRLALAPNELNGVAWWLTTSPDLRVRDPHLAVKLAAKAVEHEPNNDLFVNTLGVAHYRAGDYQAAIAALEKALDLRKGGDSNDWFFLAMAHWKMERQQDARQWYDRAVQWMMKNQPQNQELRRFWDEADEVLLHPDSAAAWRARGDTHRMAGQWNKALAAYSRLVELAPEDSDSWFLRGLAGERMRNNEKALPDFTRAVQLSPHNWVAWNHRLSVAILLRREAEVEREFDRAADKEPEAWKAMGDAYAYTQRWEKAVAAFMKLTTLKPDGLAGWQGLGNAHSGARQWDKAAAAYSRAVELDPENPSPRIQRGFVYEQLQELEKALADYTRAVELKPDVMWGAWSARLRVAIRLGRQAEVKREFVGAAGENPAAWEQMGHAYFSLQRWDEAGTAFSKLIALQPDQPNNWYYRGVARLRLREWPGVIDDLSEALKRYQGLKTPTAADSFRQQDALLGRAEAHAELGRWSAADADLRQALAVQTPGPISAAYRYKQGLVRLQLGDRDGYRQVCAALGKASDESLLANPVEAYHAAWAWVLLPDAVADYDRPIRLARQLVTRAPKSYAEARLLGAAQLRAGKAEEAVQELTRATTLQENAPAAWLLLALAHHRLGHADEARRWLAKAVPDTDRPPQRAPGGQIPWNERLVLQFLRQEAVGQINPPAATAPPGR